MAQAAKQLRKNKDLEAQAEQERKEKEEEKVKKRSRSRDKKRKVLGPGGVVGVRCGGKGWGAGGFSVMTTCSGVMRHTWKLSHECVSTVCVESIPGTTCMSCAYKHGETVTHCMLSSSQLSCLSEKTARWLSLCLCLSSHPSLLLCTAVWCSFHHGISHSWRQLVSCCNSPCCPPSVASVCHGNDCRGKPAASRLTGKSQAELAALLVNNTLQLRQSTSAGMYHRLYSPRFTLISLRPVNENDSSADCAIGDWRRIGSEQTCEGPVAPWVCTAPGWL